MNMSAVSKHGSDAHRGSQRAEDPKISGGKDRQLRAGPTLSYLGAQAYGLLRLIKTITLGFQV